MIAPAPALLPSAPPRLNPMKRQANLQNARTPSSLNSSAKTTLPSTNGHRTSVLDLLYHSAATTNNNNYNKNIPQNGLSIIQTARSSTADAKESNNKLLI